MKIPKIINAVFVIIGGLTVTAAVVALLFYLILPSLDPSEEEKFRLSSPDMKYDAVVTIQRGQMAFGSHHFNLYVVSHGTQFNKNDKEFRYYNFRAPTLNTDGLIWLSPTALKMARPSDEEIEKFIPDAGYPNSIRIHLMTSMN